MIGIILTGANNDGSAGLKAIKDKGGLTLVQDPETSLQDIMPLAAIKTQAVDYVLAISEISLFLTKQILNIEGNSHD